MSKTNPSRVCFLLYFVVRINKYLLKGSDSMIDENSIIESQMKHILDKFRGRVPSEAYFMTEEFMHEIMCLKGTKLTNDEIRQILSSVDSTISYLEKNIDKYADSWCIAAYSYMKDMCTIVRMLTHEKSSNDIDECTYEDAKDRIRTMCGFNTPEQKAKYKFFVKIMDEYKKQHDVSDSDMVTYLKYIWKTWLVGLTKMQKAVILHVIAGSLEHTPNILIHDVKSEVNKKGIE